MIPSWLSWIDVAFVVAILLFAWGGYQKGFAAQVAHILTFIFMGALLFFAYPHAHSYLRDLMRVDDTYIMWGIIVLLVALSIGAFIVMSKLLAKMLKAQVSESTDHMSGLLLGATRGLLAALLFMILLAMLGPQHVCDSLKEKSRVGRVVAYRLVPIIHPHLNSGVIRRGIEKGRELLEEEKEANERARYGDE